MTTQNISKKITLAEYFVMEENADKRHEFDNGFAIEMAYASDNHELIVGNLVRLLGNCLENSNCLVYPSNRLLFVPDCEKTYYPDVSIYCGSFKIFVES